MLYIRERDWGCEDKVIALCNEVDTIVLSFILLLQEIVIICAKVLILLSWKKT